MVVFVIDRKGMGLTNRIGTNEKNRNTCCRRYLHQQQQRSTNMIFIQIISMMLMLSSIWLPLGPSSIVMTMAFTANLPYQTHSQSKDSSTNHHQDKQRRLYMVPLSNEEIFARAAQQKQQQQLLNERNEPTSLFDNEMLQKMSFVLSILNDRAVKGPQSIESMLDIQQLEDNLQFIYKEMVQNQHLKPTRPPVSSPTSINTNMNSNSNANINNMIQENVNNNNDVTDSTDSSNTDDDDEYDSASTTNTYIIPNMEQMTSAEYQYQLQQTIIQHQKTRRQNQNISTGNQSSWDYMNQLGANKNIMKDKYNINKKEE